MPIISAIFNLFVFFIMINIGAHGSYHKIQKYGGNFAQYMYNERTPHISSSSISIVLHASYNINLSSNWDENSWWIVNIINEINYASEIGAYCIVVHFGKKKELSLATAYNNMYSALLYVCNKTKDTNVKIALETTSGQGSEMCSKIEDLAYFYKKFNNPRIKICIDTCHIFQAGYDIRNKQSIKLYMDTFNELIGINNIILVHLNDSKLDIGCLKDRHANIGKGYIGLSGILEIARFCVKKNIPMILETPNKGYKTEIQLIFKNL